MTHDELLANISDLGDNCLGIMAGAKMSDALRTVVELHEPKFYPAGCEDETCCPEFFACENCGAYYPCPTIQAIEKELK